MMDGVGGGLSPKKPPIPGECPEDSTIDEHNEALSLVVALGADSN